MTVADLGHLSMELNFKILQVCQEISETKNLPKILMCREVRRGIEEACAKKLDVLLCPETRQRDPKLDNLPRFSGKKCR